MITITLDDFQRDPAGYMKRVLSGETALLMQGDKPVAELKPVPATTQGLRPYALCAGEFTVLKDFNAPLPEDVLTDFGMA